MITGAVTSEREPLIRLRVGGCDGPEAEVEAVIDTGFNGFLAIPPALVSRLGLSFAGLAQATPGDGSNVQLSLFEAVVVWDGRSRNVDVLQADGGPLVGMSLLYGFELTVHVVEGGAVTIEPLT